MRSFKSKLLTAWAWAAPALTAAIPRGRGLPNGTPSLLDLDLQESYAQATFSVPCEGCLGQEHPKDDDSLILNFRTHASEENCGSSNITLNGVYLPQEWSGDFATGSGSFSSGSDIEENAWYLQHDLDLEWKSACLRFNESGDDTETRDAAQVLTVSITGIDGKPLEKPSGFTISFKQTSPPELLRLEATPHHYAGEEANAKAWREPPAHLRLVLAPLEEEEPTSGDKPSQSSLEDDIRELRALQTEVQQLQKVIEHKRKAINSQLKQEAQGFKEELQQCDSATCVVKAVAHKAHGAWRLLYITFRPSHHSHGPAMGRPGEGAWRAGPHRQHPEATMKIDTTPPPPPPPGPPFAEDFHPSPAPPQGDAPPPPPPPPHHYHGFHPPPPNSPFVIALEILVGVLCCGCIYTVIRNRCSSVRTRTERAAVREERRNARAYRRAARKHAWRNFWRFNRRDQERIENYEEKRALIQDQESILEDAMQEEIRQLRNAHTVVNSIVQAEEGRINTGHCGGHVHCHCHDMSTPPSPASSVYSRNSLAGLSSRPLSRTSSLPGYMSDASGDPPAYETDEDITDFVPNGFRQYTPSTSSESSRWTPDSSVVDVSPRTSAETIRYAETTDTGVGDVKN